MIVAHAAPATPNSNPKISIGSSTMFRPNDPSKVYIENRLLPSPIAMKSQTICNSTSTEQAPRIRMYMEASVKTSLRAPSRCRIGPWNNVIRMATLTPKPMAKAKARDALLAASWTLSLPSARPISVEAVRPNPCPIAPTSMKQGMDKVTPAMALSAYWETKKASTT